MSSLIMPAVLHEALGERQRPAHLMLIVGFGAAASAFAVGLYPAVFAGMPLWQSALAVLILFDIAAGCVANFTPGTNSYYATRPAHRWVFIALHVHVLLFAVLIGAPMAPAVALWLFTITVATITNLLRDRANQRITSAVLVLVGLLVIVFGGVFDPLLAFVGTLFLIKVAYAFAVDHEGTLQRETIAT